MSTENPEIENALNTDSQDDNGDYTMEASDSVKTPWIFKNIGFGLTILLTSLIAMWATITIIVERAILLENPDYITSCDLNPWLSCGQVMKSWQAGTFGFPNTYIGIVGFTILITVAMSILASAQFKKWYWLTMNFGQLFAIGFSAWLWYSAVYSIGTLCLYCMIVWFMVTIQFAMITGRNIHYYTHGSLSKNIVYYVAPFVVLVAIAVIASILLQFGTKILMF